MKQLHVVACLLMLALAGCDNNDKPSMAAKNDTPAPQTTLAKDPAQLHKLMQQSQGKPLTLLDASEVQLDGAATLVLTFSIPLDPEQDFSRVLHVVDKKKRQSGWSLGTGAKFERATLTPSRT